MKELEEIWLLTKDRHNRLSDSCEQRYLKKKGHWKLNTRRVEMNWTTTKERQEIGKTGRIIRGERYRRKEREDCWCVETREQEYKEGEDLFECNDYKTTEAGTIRISSYFCSNDHRDWSIARVSTVFTIDCREIRDHFNTF